MPDSKIVFLDFDDTLSDQFRFNTQYAREVGALLATQFGGDPDAWAKAAIDALEALERDYIARFVGNPLAGYNVWLEGVRRRSAELVFGAMEFPIPPDAERLATDTQFEALLRCDAAFPGAADALQTLNTMGCRVQMASGQESEWLRGALIGAGLETFIGRKFGPDLVDCAKEGPEYYARVFAEAGVKPSDALVVDDYPLAIEWALTVGAKVIQAKLSQERHHPAMPGVAAICTDLRQLPDLIKAAAC